MDNKRIDCTECVNFIKAEFEDEDNLFSKIKTKAKCKLGRKIIFRKPKSPMDLDWGYIRKCDKFKNNKMRLTNKQLEIIVNEIYEQVSIPIIKTNEEAINKIKIDIENDEYLKDSEKFNQLQKKIDKLKSEQDILIRKYLNKHYNGFYIAALYNNVFKNTGKYIKYLKEKAVGIKTYPNLKEIEKQVILTGNKDIPVLIEQMVSKFKV